MKRRLLTFVSQLAALWVRADWRNVGEFLRSQIRRGEDSHPESAAAGARHHRRDGRANQNLSAGRPAYNSNAEIRVPIADSRQLTTVEHCCDTKSNGLDVLWASQSRILWIVLAINAGMFVVEAAAGLIAGSAALLGDSLDMLGDALVYGVSLAVIGRSQRARAGAAAMKGTAMLLFGVAVLAEVVYKLYTQDVPNASIMSITAAAALAANSICLVLLTRHRADDINMRSAWICSRNDLIANAGVILAAAGVFLTNTIWPDIAVGLLITGLFLRSSIHVLRQATSELRRAAASTHGSAEQAA